MNKKRIVKVLENVGNLKGILCIHDFEHVLGTQSKYINDYLAVLTLAELIKKDKAEIIFNVDENDGKMEYLCRLLDK